MWFREYIRLTPVQYCGNTLSKSNAHQVKTHDKQVLFVRTLSWICDPWNLKFSKIHEYWCPTLLLKVKQQCLTHEKKTDCTYLYTYTLRQIISTYKWLLRRLSFSYLPVHCPVQFWHLSTPFRCHLSRPTPLRDQYQTGLREQYATGPRDHSPTGRHQILAGTHRRMTGSLHRNSPAPEQNNSLT